MTHEATHPPSTTSPKGIVPLSFDPPPDFSRRFDRGERVEHGGSARLYKGYDRVLKSDVAVKILYPVPTIS